jgi:pSer/pThr/pTyr-binding forkhead associated (FHA) protein
MTFDSNPPEQPSVKLQAQPHLVALAEGVNIPLDKPIVLIGRHQECDIQIPSRKISRRHCCIALVNDHLVIRDLGSTNGVRINGVKVVEGNLQAEDEVMIGNVLYQVKWITEEDNTQRAPVHNGIEAGPPPVKPARRNVPHDESRDEPVPLAEEVKGHPALPSAPEFPEAVDVELVPLDPPSHT